MKSFFEEVLTLVHMDFRLNNIILNSSLKLNIIDYVYCKISDRYVKIRRDLKKDSELWISFKKWYGKK